MTAKEYRERCAMAGPLNSDQYFGHIFNVPFIAFDNPHSLYVWIDHGRPYTGKTQQDVCNIAIKGACSTLPIPDSVLIQFRDWLNEKFPKEKTQGDPT